MFTGIITAIGEIRELTDRGDLRIVIGCPYDPSGIAIGASIACSGVCLTVVDRGGEAGDAWFAVDVSGETVSKTAQDQWRKSRRLNLEQALRLGDELGGHIVTGHVDAVGRVTLREEVGGSIHFAVTTPAEIAPFVATKGSITVDGVSLTVNALDDHADGTCTFHLNVIPHTAEVTTLGDLQAGDAVNLEIDVLARYLQRMEKLRR
ncbi:riboflavin synthase [Novosphingobium sp.]|uniref:riboflavin synthase n=1 Tax=Novosphingobium sp. TaxID=1874826 RepID=UPI0025FA5C90|nr:riboflavin synthase [Novosphingobium sp.]MCC6924410.1 riboflavin synthase [Novosphingobium sp.]